MKKAIIAAILLVLPSASFGQSMYRCGVITVMSAEESGKRISLVLDSAVVARTSKWTPGNGEPPLSVARAASIALAWATERYKRYDSVGIRELSLAQFNCWSLSDHWYYRVEFAPIIDGNRLLGSGNWAAVPMDGTVVAPIETRVSADEPLEGTNAD